MFMQLLHPACQCCMSMLLGHAASTVHAKCLCSICILLVHAACPCYMPMLHVHAGCPCWCLCCMSMLLNAIIIQYFGANCRCGLEYWLACGYNKFTATWPKVPIFSYYLSLNGFMQIKRWRHKKGKSDPCRGILKGGSIDLWHFWSLLSLVRHFH
jgi:hypothetical protein